MYTTYHSLNPVQNIVCQESGMHMSCIQWKGCLPKYQHGLDYTNICELYAF